ncbi:FkbM family methyltransferase [Paenibacillus radicis (ex Xue et al. 2023)]|uniref:FkbM family methyltransferase n=1 Tax=Paenibacillus radicis (ex Xue et al. 2023) TaxID=2972489 RepID=A0ABT1Y9F1_9BACL|nr:FkbM family methyltransferase [Paenibacillus radicis (ex Xue et al. 2023)]MCR8629806.1 FkbM family methyltransferase [Paenibacillus radicis (ex Xue et al. 2023)]
MIIMQADERALKESLLLDIGNSLLLNRLAKLYYSLGRLTEAKFINSKAIEVCADPYLSEIIKLELYMTERSIQYESENANVANFDFLDVLIKELLENLGNDYRYNIDFEMFELMRRAISDTLVVNPRDERAQIVKHLQGIANLYYSLADQSSRDLLIKLLTFRMLGNKKVMLPLNVPEYWSRRQFVRQLKSSEEAIKTRFHQWNLHLFDLRPLGYAINFYCFPIGLSATFVEKQYEYGKVTPSIKAEPGDIVIDAGGCFGDTALYFAHEVGEAGHVYTFEFIPSNLEIMKRNLQLNSSLQERISIVEHPVWNDSDQLLYYIDKGPASFVAFSKIDGDCGTTLTLSIDGLVKQKNLDRIDFIKMDIEGAEWSALKGAKETLEAFRPKLAITIYHQVSDFEDIAGYINELNLGYRFYLGHFTIYAEETVLFAICD